MAASPSRSPRSSKRHRSTSDLRRRDQRAHVCGVDDSRASLGALRVASDLGDWLGSRLVVVHVLAPDDSPRGNAATAGASPAPSRVSAHARSPIRLIRLGLRETVGVRPVGRDRHRRRGERDPRRGDRPRGRGWEYGVEFACPKRCGDCLRFGLAGPGTLLSPETGACLPRAQRRGLPRTVSRSAS